MTLNAEKERLIALVILIVFSVGFWLGRSPFEEKLLPLIPGDKVLYIGDRSDRTNDLYLDHCKQITLIALQSAGGSNRAWVLAEECFNTNGPMPIVTFDVNADHLKKRTF